MIKGFNQVNVYIKEKGIVKKTVSVENGKISNINDEVCEDFLNLDDNLILVPGFIDEHIHGANHSDTMYGTISDLENIAKTIAKEGVTSFLPTTMTQSIEAIDKALSCINQYMSEDHDGAKVLGAHLEGPFISKKHKGAQGEGWILSCDVEKFKHFEEVSGNNIRLVTLAYEENGEELVKYLKSRKITASIGHTDSTFNQATEGISKGISCSTHTYNAMLGFKHREPGTVGAVLLSDEIRCEVIADLVHVSSGAIKLLYKAKGKENIIAITDAMEAKHMPDGEYALGGQKVFVQGKEARLADGTIAGSTLKLNEALFNLKKVLELPLEDVIDFATVNPAKNLGIYETKGSIEIGKDADFTVIDKDFNIYLTISGGNIIYRK